MEPEDNAEVVTKAEPSSPELYEDMNEEWEDSPTQVPAEAYDPLRTSEAPGQLLPISNQRNENIRSEGRSTKGPHQPNNRTAASLNSQDLCRLFLPGKSFCNLCGKVFNSKKSLSYHLKIHSGDKRYECESCGMRFIQRSSLVVHVRQHSGEKPFPCEVCGKRFTQRIHVISHMRVHMKHKPFPCSICGKGYMQKNTLMLHMLLHNEGVCDKVSDGIGSVKQPKRKH